MTWHHEEFDRRVDELLAEQRPDRYEQGEAHWIDGVADQVKSLVPESEARFLAAKDIVKRRETTKTRQTNKLLRDIFKSGQFPLDWLETMHLPLAIEKERVALRACTAEDFEDFGNRERRAAAADFSSRNETCEAAQWIAEQMRGNGWTFGREIELS